MRTIYEANDGSHFDSSEECQQHELKIKFNKYKNYTELHKNVDNLWHDHIENNTDSLTMAAFIIFNIELLNNMITDNLKQVDNAEEFTAGQTILVRLSPWDDWEKKVFVSYAPSTMYPYICENNQVYPYICKNNRVVNAGILHWKYAKSIR
jgi:hypothetical protein